MDALRPRLLAFTLCLLGAYLAPAAASDDATRAIEETNGLKAQYEKLLKYNDYTSFSQRMRTVRALGAIAHPHARSALLDIVRRAKLLDDKAVAVLALGRELDLGTAKKLADLVAQRPKGVLVQALGDAFRRAGDEKVLTWLATDALKHKSPAVLQAALDAQYAHGDPRCLERAGEIFDLYGEKRDGVTLQHAAVRALGSIGTRDAEHGRKVRSFLIRCVPHEDWRIRLAVADVMAWQVPQDVNTRGALRRLLVDDAPVVRQRAAATIGDAKMQELGPDVARRLADVHIRTRAVAHDALTRMTHKDLGYDPADWKRYFDSRNAEVNPSMPAPSTSVATYYGVDVHTDRVVFIVDVSGSMAMPRDAKRTRMDVARAELQKVLSNLSPKTYFNVIVFSDKVKAWRKSEAFATRDTVAQALKWVDRTLAEPRGGTFMHAALERAFADNPEMDTIFLLTDGLATDGEPIVPEAILASVSGWNRYRRVVIHTFALTLEKDSPHQTARPNLELIKRFMAQLARATGGTTKVVDKAP